jgi:hypothetical protein
MLTQQLGDKLQAAKSELAMMVVVVVKLTVSLSVKTFSVFYGTEV